MSYVSIDVDVYFMLHL